MSYSSRALRTASFYAVTVLGVVFFQLIHAFHFLAESAEGGAELAELAARAGNAPGMYVSVVMMLLFLVTVLLPLLGRGRVAAWTTLVLGALLIALSVFDGFHHGVSEGLWFFTLSAVGGVGIPGVLALVSNWGWAAQGGEGGEW